MNDAEIAKMGDDARQVLNNPAFQQAMAQMHELAHKAFKQTDLRDAEGLKIARQFASVTDDFETILKRMIEGGKFAQANLDKHRDESAMKKAARKVFR
ncbi:hypothetical protein [Acidovorax sp.]|uniref:hypothetical protein n=1 Tax=Acidovorax sp. TaxID=1872122 RepID=UPI0039199E7C